MVWGRKEPPLYCVLVVMRLSCWQWVRRWRGGGRTSLVLMTGHWTSHTGHLKVDLRVLKAVVVVGRALSFDRQRGWWAFFQSRDIAHPSRKMGGLALHLIFHRFSPCSCQVSFCSLIKGITPKTRMLCFVLINSVFLTIYVFGSCLTGGLGRRASMNRSSGSEWASEGERKERENVSVGMWVGVCVCVRERERDRERERKCVRVCVCVCDRERETVSLKGSAWVTKCVQARVRMCLHAFRVCVVTVKLQS